MQPASGNCSTQSTDLPIAFDSIQDQTILFKWSQKEPSVHRVETQLSDIKYLGVLRGSENSQPYFLFTARPCKDCSDDLGIFIVRPEEKKPIAYTFPGKILEPNTRQLLHESRAFYGKCAPNSGDVLIYFQHERVDRKKHLQPSVLMVQAAKDHLHETLLERNLPGIKYTLNRVKAKECFEISGRNRLMTTHTIRFNPQAQSTASSTLPNTAQTETKKN